MKNFYLIILSVFFAGTIFAQSTHTIDFEPAGTGADWSWTVTENGDNPPLEFVGNPDNTGINTSATAAKFIARAAGNAWALTFTDGDGEFTFDASNSIVKIMVYKPTISNVGMKFEGMSPAVEIQIPNTLTNQWEELTFDFSASIGNSYSRIVIIPDFDTRAEDHTIYFDNIMVPDGEVSGPLPEPETAPPVPAHAAADVISVYTEVYPNLAGTNFNPNWGQSTSVTIDYNVAGNNTLKYENLNYQGTEFTNQDVSGYDFLHVDFWTPNSTTLDFFLISPGNETGYALPITTETWVSVDIPLSQYVPPVNLSDVFQFKVVGNGTVYFDNWYFWKEPSGLQPVTFKVDMSEYTESFTNVYVSGSFNDWSGEANQMLDPDMDGIYETEIELNEGTYEYKFTLDNWSAQEEFAGGEPCTVTGGDFTNRFLEVSGSEELPPVCWNSCYACGYVPEVYDVTLSVDMNEFEGSFTNVYVSGSFNDWSGEANQMLDPDMDGIYETTLQLAAGSYEYKITLDNWAVQELFNGGEPCTIESGGFVNRLLEVSGTATLPAVCWNSCSPCGAGPEPVDVTFRVDMSQYQGAFSNVYISGSFNGWCGDCNPLSDPEMDGVFETTIPLLPGNIEYKFTLDNWAVQEEFEGGEPCTLTTGAFTNRFLEVTEAAVLPVVCWNSCESCPDYMAGWNGISSNVMPESKISLEELFSPVIDDLVIMIGNDGIFWPGQNLNTLGDWDPYKGYKVKFADGVHFEFSGAPLTDRSLTLEPGIYYIPVLSEGPVGIEDVIMPLGNAIEFMYNITNMEIYWPTGGIVPGVPGALEELAPGFAYLSRINETVTIDFGNTIKTAAAPQHNPAAPTPEGWNRVKNTGIQHIISINASGLNNGDIIGAFDASGICAGIAECHGTDQQIPMVVFGEDITTAEKAGMADHEMISFKLFRNGVSTDLEAVYDPAAPNANGRFMQNGLSIISGFKTGTSGISNAQENTFTVYPNPSAGEITIITGQEANYNLQVMDTRGQTVYSGPVFRTATIDLKDQPGGVYFVRLTNTSRTFVKKIIIR